ncbi:unnamed protein product, partial [Brassica rapa]
MHVACLSREILIGFLEKGIQLNQQLENHSSDDGYDDENCGKYCRHAKRHLTTLFVSLSSTPIHVVPQLTSSASVSSSSTKSRRLGQRLSGRSTWRTKLNRCFKRVLDECNLRYKTIVEADVHTAIIAIKGNPKLAEDAIVDAGLEASVCEGGFPKDQSPLTDLTQKMVKICDVTRAIVRMFL